MAEGLGLALAINSLRSKSESGLPLTVRDTLLKLRGFVTGMPALTVPAVAVAGFVAERLADEAELKLCVRFYAMRWERFSFKNRAE